MKRSQMKRGTSQMKRGTQMKSRDRIKARKFSKEPTGDGASERDIKDECDQLVRDILRLRDSQCVNAAVEICCAEKSNLHVGHYISRGILAVRWDLENCNLQCDWDNAAHEYNTNSYRAAIAKIYGGDAVRRLERIGRENPELQYVDLLAIRDGLRAELARWQ